MRATTRAMRTATWKWNLMLNRLLRITARKSYTNWVEQDLRCNPSGCRSGLSLQHHPPRSQGTLYIEQPHQATKSHQELRAQLSWTLFEMTLQSTTQNTHHDQNSVRLKFPFMIYKNCVPIAVIASRTYMSIMELFDEYPAPFSVR